jgi:hypothetical protein
MHRCRCQLNRDLERRARLLAQEIETAREALRFELPLDERLELVAEEFELQALLRRIEERRFELAR